MRKEGEELNQEEQFAQEAVERLMSPDGEFKDSINQNSDDDVDDEIEQGKKDLKDIKQFISSIHLKEKLFLSVKENREH